MTTFAGKFPTMFQPSTAFTYENTVANAGKLPDLSPAAKISFQDTQNLAFFAQQVFNGTLDYLIINVFGSGSNLPVRNSLLPIISPVL